MKHLGRNIPAYRQIAALRMQVAYTYRTNAALELVSLLLKVYLLKMVFVAVYAGRETVDGITLRQVITFVTIANLQMFLLVPVIAWYVYERVREGQVAFDIARPAPFLSQLLAHQVGETVSAVPFVVLALPCAALLGGLQAPQSLMAGLLYMVSLGLGYLVAALMSLIIGLIAFWTLELGGVLVIYMFANQFFGGALVPLWFFPPSLRRVVDLLPFQAQTFIPLSMYTGQVSGMEAVQALALQLFWVVTLSGLAWLLWRRAIYRVVIQGG